MNLISLLNSVAMNGTEIDLEVTEGIFNNKKKDNNTKEHKNFGKQEEQKIVSSKIEEEEEALKMQLKTKREKMNGHLQATLL